MTASESLPIAKVAAAPATVSPPTLWLAYDRTAPAIPEGFTDIDDLAAEFDSDPSMRPLMEEARKGIAQRFYSDQRTLASLRLERGWSQARLASEVQTSQPHIARIESGEADARLATIARIALCLSVSVGELAEILNRSRQGK